jgi:RND family efflux transporter MFP subunit
LTDAQAQFEATEAEVKTKTKALADSVIVAPFDGSVSVTFVENFQNVRMKESVIRLLDLSTIELKIDIPEKLISRMAQVESIQVHFDAFPGELVPAKITEIGTEASASTRTYPVTLAMEQPEDFQILPGMTGLARGWPGEEKNETSHLVVPGSATFESDGEEFVWVVNESNSTVQKRRVTSGGVSVSGVLLQGIKSGELVVTAGTHYLSEGQEIKLLNPSKDAGNQP